MIHAATSLYGLLRAFFEQEMRGIARWDDVQLMDRELAENRPDGRRNRLGKFKEIAAVTFRGYELTIKSPEEAPPLGLVECRCGDLVESGPIDQATWVRLGKFIRENESAGHGS